MTIIKTHLRTTTTDHQGNIKLTGNGQTLAFSGVFKLGLILGSQDDETKRLPVDEQGLIDLKGAVNGVINDCLFSLIGLGGFISNCEPVTPLTHSDLHGVGSVIQNLALLAQESMDHLESIEMDTNRRNQGGES